MRNIYGVEFKPNGKVYYFNAEKLECPINVTVIVRTERGEQFGKVVMKVNEANLNTSIDDLSPIMRIATKNDYKKHLSLLKEQEEAMNYAKVVANELNLNMRFMDSSFTFDRKQLLLNFLADERIDFRELVKDLAAVFRTRIELRQIGVRDETKIRGGIGICGRPLCCHTYLSEFAPVSIKMAKEQNLSLNPTKISGVCGRLMCCLTNEEETYEVLNSQLPSVGDIVTTNDGLTGVVQSLSVLRRLVKVIVNLENDEKEIREYKADDLKFRPRRKKQKVTKEEQKKLAALEKKEGASKLDDK